VFACLWIVWIVVIVVDDEGALHGRTRPLYLSLPAISGPLKLDSFNDVV
jgi:hypothetical protein